MKFSKAEKALIVQRIQRYVSDELGQELGSFDAEFLLDFFAEQIGPYFYNRGLYDAQAILTARLDEIGDAIVQLEKPTEFQR